MQEIDLREQACWLLIAFESELTTRIVNTILVIWCKQLERTLQDFFAADDSEWINTCLLSTEIVQKLELAREKLVGQVFLAEQLQHEQIGMLTVLDPDYPSSIKSALTRSHIPPVLFYSGDLAILKRQTLAIIGSRNAGESSLAFTRTVAHYLATHGANVISGHARGVDRTAYEGATSTDEGHTTVVLPQGIRKLSNVQKRDLQPRIESGQVLLLSQFHPDAGWLMSRAMERNNIVTSLAQVVIVAESDSKGGTWEGANGALRQKRRLYVRQTETGDALPGNTLLLEKGGLPLVWPTQDIATTLSPLLEESYQVQEQQHNIAEPLSQLSLLGTLEQ